MLGLVEVGLDQILVGLTIIALLAGSVVVVWYTFWSKKRGVKRDVIQEWRDVADAQNVKICLLEDGLKECREEHKTCERKFNDITQTVLRFLARERSYRHTINRLEVRAGLPATDWDDITDAPESFDP